MLQQVWPWQGFLCRDNAFQVAREFGQGQEFLCDKVFLCRDRVWPRYGILGCDRVFSCHDQVWGKGQESLRRDREFDVVTWYTLRHDREFKGMRSSMLRHSVLFRDSGERHFVTTRLSHATETPCCDNVELGIWVEPDGLTRYFGGSGREISSPNKIWAYWPSPNGLAAHSG